MPHIVVSEEQARLIVQATERVEVRDPRGNIVAVIKPTQTQADIEEMKKRLADPNRRLFTSAQVHAHLQALTEAAERGLNEVELRALSRRLQDETPSHGPGADTAN